MRWHHETALVRTDEGSLVFCGGVIAERTWTTDVGRHVGEEICSATEGTALAYDVELREVQSQPIASIRATTTPEEIGKTLTGDLSKIYGLLAQQGIRPTGPPVAVYYDFQPDRVVVESGVPIAGSFQSDGEIKPSALPSGRAVFTRHLGPYAGLGGAHDAVHQWIDANGYVATGPNWEIYPMPPGGEPDPAKVVTEVYWRVQ